MTDEHYRIGELAQSAGVTVRALHHYDRLGLLVPSARTHGGHRLYAAADVQRLYRLLALRELGLPLGEIATVLDADDALAGTVRRHLGHVERRLERLEGLRLKLTTLLAALDGGDRSTTPFLEALEAMSMFEKYYTPEQLAQLERRREEFGDEKIKSVEREWADLYASLREHRELGTEPADPAVQALGRRADELVEMFTGGDPGIRASLQRMYEQEGTQRASRGMADPEDQAYLAAIKAARS
jgi:MerR family transcriptional regulator, thiopeptide resistance regulator